MSSDLSAARVNTATLEHPGLPLLTCTLLELNSLGCICEICTWEDENGGISFWQNILTPLPNVGVCIQFSSGEPSFVRHEGTVQSVALNEGRLNLVIELAPSAPTQPQSQDSTVAPEQGIVESPNLSARAKTETILSPRRSSTRRFEDHPDKSQSAAQISESADAKTAAQALQPQSSAAPLDATVEIDRPQSLARRDVADPVPRNTAEPAAAALDLNATVAMERPSGLGQSPVEQEKLALTAPAERPAPDSQRPNISDAQANPPPRAADSRDPASGALSYAKKLGEVLVEMGKLSQEQMQEALELSSAAGERLGRWLIRWDLVQPEALCRALAIQTGLPMTVLSSEGMPQHLTKLFPLPLMMHHNFVPFDDSGVVVCVAACNPLDAQMVREQEKIVRKVVEVFLAQEDQVARQLDWLRFKMRTRSRRTLRHSMRLTVSYQFCNRLGARLNREVHAGCTCNLSEGGYLIEGPAGSEDPTLQMEKGMYVNVCIKSMTGEIWAVCDIREIRVVGEAREPRWLMGVEIMDISPECKARLKNLCRRPGRAS